MYSAKGDIPAFLLVIFVTSGLTFHFWSSVSPSAKGTAVLTLHRGGRAEQVGKMSQQQLRGGVQGHVPRGMPRPLAGGCKAQKAVSLSRVLLGLPPCLTFEEVGGREHRA